MPKIKIKYKELNRKSTKELLEMKKEMESHLFSAYAPKQLGEKNFNIQQEKRNIARINTILTERER